MRLIFLSGLIFLFVFNTKARSSTNITIDVLNYQNDTLNFGSFMAGTMIIQEKIIRSEDGKFHIKYSESLPQGMYFVQMIPDKRYFEFIIDEDQNFTIYTNYNNIYGELKCSDSFENKLFIDCLKLVNFKRKDADKLSANIKLMREKDPKQVADDQIKLNQINNQVIQEQLYLLRNNKNSLTYLFVKASQEPQPEEYNQADSVQIKTAAYFVKNHYFDNIDFSDERLMRSPYPYNSIQNLIGNNLVSKDSLTKVLDIVMRKVLTANNTSQVYFNFLIKLMSSPKPVILETGFTHIVRDYVQKNLTPWLSDADSLYLAQTAENLEPILLGKKAPYFELFQENGKLTTPYSLDSLITVLYFGGPNCNECKSVFTGLLDFHEIYKHKKVGIIGICNQSGASLNRCFQYANANLVKFPFVGSSEAINQVLLDYNVTSPPAIFVLNKNKEIIAKFVSIPELYRVVNSALLPKN